MPAVSLADRAGGVSGVALSCAGYKGPGAASSPVAWVLATPYPSQSEISLDLASSSLRLVMPVGALALPPLPGFAVFSPWLLLRTDVPLAPRVVVLCWLAGCFPWLLFRTVVPLAPRVVVFCCLVPLACPVFSALGLSCLASVPSFFVSCPPFLRSPCLFSFSFSLSALPGLARPLSAGWLRRPCNTYIL